MVPRNGTAEVPGWDADRIRDFSPSNTAPGSGRAAPVRAGGRSSPMPNHERTPAPLQLLAGDVGTESAEVGVVGQLAPWDRMLLRAHPEEASERHHRIGDPAAELVDHQPFDAADLVAARIGVGGEISCVHIRRCDHRRAPARAHRQ